MSEDVRVGKWTLRATAGTSVDFVATFEDGIDISGGVSIWIGGVVSPDPTDFTDADETVTTIDGQEATFTLVFPTDVKGSTPLRMTVDGALYTCDRLHISRSGTATPDGTVTVVAEPVSITISVAGGGTGGGGGGVTVHNNLTGRSVADAHPISAVTGLTAALAGKAATVHSHTITDVTGLATTLQALADGLAAVGQSPVVIEDQDDVGDFHAESNVTVIAEADATAEQASIGITAQGYLMDDIVQKASGGAELGVALDAAAGGSAFWEITASDESSQTVAGLTVTAIDGVASAHLTLGAVQLTDAELADLIARVADLDASVVLRGSWDASAGTFPGGGTAQAGSSYIVSVAGTVGGVAFGIGDRAIAITDNASTTVFASNWFKADYTDQVLSVVGLTGAVTATQIRDALLAVDGSGSGLDADTVDGLEASAFVRTTGGETIAGAKVFSTAPTVPADAYDATGWNGKQEPATKDAVRDLEESRRQLSPGVRTTVNTSVSGQIATDVTLANGIAGGDTLMGGTAAGENLCLQATDHATMGSVFILGENVTYTAAPAPLFGVSSARTLTANYASQKQPVGILFAETRVMTTAGAAGAAASVGFQYGAIYKNANGVAANLASGALGSAGAAFYDTSTLQADGATVLMGIYTSFQAAPTISGINSGVMTNGSYSAFSAGGAVTDVTLASYTGLSVNSPTLSGTGAITTWTGILVGSMSGATTNIGIRNNITLRQVGMATFGANAAPTYGIHMQATTGDAGAIHLAEQASTPTNPASGAGIVMYHKTDAIVFAFNDGGTMRYKSLTMTGTGVTWVHSTSAP